MTKGKRRASRLEKKNKPKAATMFIMSSRKIELTKRARFIRDLPERLSTTRPNLHKTHKNTTFNLYKHKNHIPMSNFQFLRAQWPSIYKEAREAEKLTLISPKAAAILCRSALEKGVRWLYDHDYDLTWPYDTKLSSLIHERCFREIIKPSMYREINLIRLNGNNGAHGKPVSQYEALASLKNLFRFLSFIGKYYSEGDLDIPLFDEYLIPDGQEVIRTRRELQKLAEELEKSQEAANRERKQLAQQAEEIEKLRQELAASRKAATQRRVEREKEVPVEKAIPILIPESATRKLYIDVLLKDAGWTNLTEGREIEYEVKGMPASTNPSGKGYADYVLWGKDGKPLAVVEAKRTMADARKGEHIRRSCTPIAWSRCTTSVRSFSTPMGLRLLFGTILSIPTGKSTGFIPRTSCNC
jgi:hypothetical protein